ncbi:cytochrome c oxidase assembly protein [Cohnella cellulosilytica]|uniref:Cytochrome c oxidase assembly protein n=1 Tax=Cohnella cellulosilytica TaxID=986710 RepID=A0ABW2FAR4_9BACL
MLVVVAVAALLYAKAGNGERRGDHEAVLSPARQASFYAGLLCLYFGYGGVLSALARQSIDTYVLQLCLRYLAMVPLMIAGLPQWIRQSLLRRISGGVRLIRNGQEGTLAALLFFLSLSVLLWPKAYQMMNEWELLRFPLQGILLGSSWFMWEAMLRPCAARKQRLKIRTRLSILGSVVLFPVCVAMTGSQYGITTFRPISMSELCGAPQTGVLTTASTVASISMLGGILLMGALQLSLALAAAGMKNRTL